MRPESIFSADWMAVKCAATANHSTEISCRHRHCTSNIYHPSSQEMVLAITAMQACRCFLCNVGCFNWVWRKGPYATSVWHLAKVWHPVKAVAWVLTLVGACGIACCMNLGNLVDSYPFCLWCLQYSNIALLNACSSTSARRQSVWEAKQAVWCSPLL